MIVFLTVHKAYANVGIVMMKLKATTPASITQYTKRAFLIVSALVLVGAGAFALKSQPAAADQYDDKIASLQADMARYQAEADRLNAEATTLANALAQITNEKNALQAQIDVGQAQYDKLVIQIADTEKQIQENQDALGTTIADLYIDDSISPIEMLASSQNIGDYLDKQEYRNSVKDQLSTTIKKVRDLKAQLSQQKSDVEKVLAEQKSARDSLAAKQAEQANLLASTQNDEANYQNMIKDNQSQIAAAKAAQAAIRARANSTGGGVLVDAGSLAAYPWNESNCWMIGYMSEGGAGNGLDGHGYGCRQCVSYVAWRVAKETGVYYDTVLGNGGSAAYNLAQRGYQNLGRTPQPGSVASLWGTSSAPYSSASSPGHTAYVEDVSPDGSKVLVSQYNYNYGSGYGMYSKMWLSSNFFDQYVKIK